MTNFEKYKTAYDKEIAFYDFCEKKVKGCCSKCTSYGNGKGGRLSCFLNWLDLECEEEKPLPCPYCGCETETKNCVGGWCVQCDCGYMSKQFNEGDDDDLLRKDAIAAHNRVAKMCREVK